MSAPDFKAISRELNGRSAVSGSGLLLIVLALLIALVVWAAHTEIDDVTRAQARIVPSGELQVVQAAETGQITALLVGEGQSVAEGQPLMRLDPTQLRAQYDEARNQADALRARIARLEAELSGDDPAFPEDLQTSAPRLISAERALFLGNLARLADEHALIDSQRRILDRAADRARAEADLARTSRALLDEEITLIQPLVERQIEPELTLISLRREAAEQDGRIALAEAESARIEAERADLDEQERAMQSRFRAEALDRLAASVSDLGVLEQRLPALSARTERTELVAPLDGVVNRVMVTTLGGVVSQGQALIEIVPDGAGRRVEAYVSPADIAFLRPDQPVKIRLTAYDAARYGALDGHITRIGADAVEAPEGDAQVFVVEVSYEGQLTDADGRALEVIPGMVAEVDILSEKKTVLDYLTRPVIRVKDRAFRD